MTEQIGWVEQTPEDRYDEMMTAEVRVVMVVNYYEV